MEFDQSHASLRKETKFRDAPRGWKAERTREMENKHLKLLHSPYDEDGNSVARSDSFDSETIASAANTPSSDAFNGNRAAGMEGKNPIYSRGSNSDRRSVRNPHERLFPTSSYEIEEEAHVSSGSPRPLVRSGSDISLSRLSMGADSPTGSSNSHLYPAAMRSASRRSSQGDASPCLQAVSVRSAGGADLQEIQLTPSYMHHRGGSPVRIKNVFGNRREGSPSRGAPKHCSRSQREGSPTRVHFTRSFLHREGSPTRDSGCKKKNVSPRRRGGNISPRCRRPAAWQEKWGTMSHLSERDRDDESGAKGKEGSQLLKTFSLPGSAEPRRRQAQPVTRQPWPERNEERFAVGKAQMVGMEMNPFDFSSDDLCHLTLEIFNEARPVLALRPEHACVLVSCLSSFWCPRGLCGWV